MKRFLAVIGGLFLLVLVVAAGFFAYFLYTGTGLDQSSKAYVEANVPPIVSTWSKEEFLKRASPPLLKIVNEKPGLVDQLFAKFSKLGPLVTLGDVKGEANISVTTQDGKVVTAAYTSAAKFQNGEATIRVRLLQAPSGEWQFLLLNINSPLFLQ